MPWTPLRKARASPSSDRFAITSLVVFTLQSCDCAWPSLKSWIRHWFLFSGNRDTSRSQEGRSSVCLRWEWRRDHQTERRLHVQKPSRGRVQERGLHHGSRPGQGHPKVPLQAQPWNRPVVPKSEDERVRRRRVLVHEISSWQEPLERHAENPFKRSETQPDVHKPLPQGKQHHPSEAGRIRWPKNRYRIRPQVAGLIEGVWSDVWGCMSRAPCQRPWIKIRRVHPWSLFSLKP